MLKVGHKITFFFILFIFSFQSALGEDIDALFTNPSHVLFVRPTPQTLPFWRPSPQAVNSLHYLSKFTMPLKENSSLLGNTLERQQPRPEDKDNGSTLGEIAALATGVFFLSIPDQLGDPEPPDCVPCEKSDVPFFDRWVIHEENIGWQAVGWTAMGGFAIYSWVDLFDNQASGFSHFRASLESGIIAAGIATTLKEVFHRRRPVYFTDKITRIEGGELRDALRSLPSGDTAIAFALATTYVLSRDEDLSILLRIVAFSSAGLAGIGRIAGGKHFPTDVLAGTAVGIGSAYLVHKIRF